MIEETREKSAEKIDKRKVIERREKRQKGEKSEMRDDSKENIDERSENRQE